MFLWVAAMRLLLMCGVLAVGVPAIWAQAKVENDAVKLLISHANDERPLLESILDAHDEKGLNELIAEKRPVSRLGEMVYATKLYELNPQTGGIAVLRALPRSDIEMEAWEEFAHDSAKLSPVYRDFYAAAFQSVIKHTEFLHAIFQKAVQFDTENFPVYGDSDWDCSQLAKIYSAIPAEYEHALSRESAENKIRLNFCAHSHWRGEE